MGATQSYTYQLDEFHITGTDQRPVAVVDGEAIIHWYIDDAGDEVIDDVDLWLDDIYGKGLKRISEADPIFDLIRDRLERKWAAGEIQPADGERVFDRHAEHRLSASQLGIGRYFGGR